MKINSETLTAFTCSAVYYMATSTTLPPASSLSLVDGGTPMPIVHECTMIPVLPQVPLAADTITLPILNPSDVVTVPISLPIIIVSQDPYNKFSDICATPTALLPSRTSIGYYSFTSPSTGICYIAPIMQRTCIGVNKELLQQCTGTGVTAPIMPLTCIGVPQLTAGSSITLPATLVTPTPLVFSSPFQTTP